MHTLHTAFQTPSPDHTHTLVPQCSTCEGVGIGALCRQGWETEQVWIEPQEGPLSPWQAQPVLQSVGDMEQTVAMLARGPSPWQILHQRGCGVTLQGSCEFPGSGASIIHGSSHTWWPGTGGQGRLLWHVGPCQAGTFLLLIKGTAEHRPWVALPRWTTRTD